MGKLYTDEHLKRSEENEQLREEKKKIEEIKDGLSK